MLKELEPDIAVITSNGPSNGVFSVGVFRAINASAREQAGEMRDAEAEHLLRLVRAVIEEAERAGRESRADEREVVGRDAHGCLLYTSPSPRD